MYYVGAIVVTRKRIQYGTQRVIAYQHRQAPDDWKSPSGSISTAHYSQDVLL